MPTFRVSHEINCDVETFWKIFFTKEFNEKLLALGLGITRAMHVEGGPEASLTIRSAKVNLDLCGSYETGFNENDNNKQQWPIPNVIGVVASP